MKEKIAENKRLAGIACVLILIVLIVCFLKQQMDDERYFMMYDFENVPEAAYDAGGILHASQDVMKPGEVICTLPVMHLEPGVYHLQVSHQQDTYSIIKIMDREKEIASFELPASETDSLFEFRSDKDIYHLEIQFIYNGGSVDIKHAYLRADGLFYTDTIAWGLIIILLIICGFFYCLKKDIISMSDRERVYVLCFPVLFVFFNYVFLREYWMSGSGGDFSFWTGRIEQTKNELLRGQFPVQIYGDALGGHGVLGTLYPGLFVYIPAILRMMHISMESTLRMFFMMINGATMYTSYYAVKRISNNRAAALIGMIVYMTLPYRIGCLYFRFAYGEVLAMIFIPLVILGMYEIAVGDKRHWMVLVIGLTGILQSHILSMALTAFMCLLMGVLMIRSLIKEGRYISLIKTILAFIVLNLWYLLPFVECYGYELGLEQSFAVWDFYNETYDPALLFSLFSSMASVNERYKAPMIGIALWILLLLLLYSIIFDKKRNDRDLFIRDLFCVSLLFLFMQSRCFPWQTLQKFESIKSVIQMIQFPIRFGQIAQAGLAIDGAVAIAEYELYEKHIKKIGYFLIIPACILMIFITDCWVMTGLSDGGKGSLKLVPDIDLLEYEDYALAAYDRGNYPDEPISTAEINNYVKDGTHVEFDYISDGDAFADIPMQAYPGYRAYDVSGHELGISAGDGAILRVSLPKNNGKQEHVIIDYSQPFRWRVVLVISLASAVGFILWQLSDKRKHGTG